MLNPPLRSVSGVRVTCKSLSSKILAKLPLLFRELFLVLLLALTMLRFIEVLCFFLIFSHWYHQIYIKRFPLALFFPRLTTYISARSWTVSSSFSLANFLAKL